MMYQPTDHRPPEGFYKMDNFNFIKPLRRSVEQVFEGVEQVSLTLTLTLTLTLFLTLTLTLTLTLNP
jgi:hypothetical protein